MTAAAPITTAAGTHSGNQTSKRCSDEDVARAGCTGGREDRAADCKRDDGDGEDATDRGDHQQCPG
jgi:hypothetical protein